MAPLGELHQNTPSCVTSQWARLPASGGLKITSRKERGGGGLDLSSRPDQNQMWDQDQMCWPGPALGGARSGLTLPLPLPTPPQSSRRKCIFIHHHT